MKRERDEPRLLQLSGVVVDLVYRVETMPAPGEEARVSTWRLTAGGGFNAMVAARRAGLETLYAGPIGAGPFAEQARRALAAEGIRVLQDPDTALDQGCCTVLVDASGERSFVAGEGAEGVQSRAALDALALAPGDWTLLSGYPLLYRRSRDAFTAWLEEATTVGRLVLDPAPVVGRIAPRALGAALARALWVSANAREARELTGLDDPSAAAARLAAGRAGGAVVRDGARGCHLARAGADGALALPAHPVRAVDSNGAGDAHVGHFVAALARGETPETAARLANVAAALSVMRDGPATAPTRAALERALAGAGGAARGAGGPGDG